MTTFTTEDRVAVQQGTAEWHQLRLGKVTASRVADILARTKTGPVSYTHLTLPTILRV